MRALRTVVRASELRVGDHVETPWVIGEVTATREVRLAPGRPVVGIVLRVGVVSRGLGVDELVTLVIEDEGA